MRTLLLGTIISIVAAATMIQPAAADQNANDAATYFRNALTHYYGTDEDVVDSIYAKGLSDEDASMALFISGRTNRNINSIVGARSQGSSWLDIAKLNGMKPSDFFVMIVGGPDTGEYAHALAQFKPTPNKTWAQVELSDRDLVNLVNLRFIASENDWSVFEVMDLHAEGQNFVAINYEIFNRKEAYLVQQAEQEVNLAR